MCTIHGVQDYSIIGCVQSIVSRKIPLLDVYSPQCLGLFHYWMCTIHSVQDYSIIGCVQSIMSRTILLLAVYNPWCLGLFHYWMCTIHGVYEYSTTGCAQFIKYFKIISAHKHHMEHFFGWEALFKRWTRCQPYRDSQQIYTYIYNYVWQVIIYLDNILYNLPFIIFFIRCFFTDYISH